MFNENMTFEEYHENNILEGWIHPDGSPRKCKCGATEENFKKGKSYQDDIWGAMTDVEYQVVCGLCGNQVGYYVYGSWEI